MSNFTTPGVYVEEISTLPPSVAQVATAVPAFLGYTKQMPEEEQTVRKELAVTDGTGDLDLILDPKPVKGTTLSDIVIEGFDSSKLTLASSLDKLTIAASDRPGSGADPVSFTVSYAANIPVVKAIRISTLKEFTDLFGGPSGASFKVALKTNPTNNSPEIQKISKNAASDTFILYYCMQMYFNNGGGSCYVVSIGDFNTSPLEASQFTDGLTALSTVDEPTLIAFPEASRLNATDYFTVCSTALQQCSKLKDRFTIMDVQSGDTNASGFRNGIGPNDSLKYGAAYTPDLTTSLSYSYAEKDVSIQNLSLFNKGILELFTDSTNQHGIKVEYNGPSSDAPKVQISAASGAVFKIDSVAGGDSENKLTIPVQASTTLKQIVDDFSGFLSSVSADLKTRYRLSSIGTDSTGMGAKPTTNVSFPTVVNARMNEALVKEEHTGLYNAMKAALGQIRVVLPPSSAIAGVYARVDGTRGVWKAPANVSVVSVLGPSRQITHEENGRLNVDPNSGKSINVIRSFVGKGTLVWGARTLAGNDNEWRYINVRRLFITIEESVQKATAFAVFEPNDASTWLKVKAMIDNFLFGLWQQGALAGPTPESSFFVNVGLGKTMTNQDILEGRMIVEIGIAAVRPAEFIILRFSHKLQEA